MDTRARAQCLRLPISSSAYHYPVVVVVVAESQYLSRTRRRFPSTFPHHSSSVVLFVKLIAPLPVLYVRIRCTPLALLHARPTIIERTHNVPRYWLCFFKWLLQRRWDKKKRYKRTARGPLLRTRIWSSSSNITAEVAPGSHVCTHVYVCVHTDDPLGVFGFIFLFSLRLNEQHCVEIRISLKDILFYYNRRGYIMYN